eukprot:3381777-Pyramimonas_sp.AAC.1
MGSETECGSTTTSHGPEAVAGSSSAGSDPTNFTVSAPTYGPRTGKASSRVLRRARRVRLTVNSPLDPLKTPYRPPMDLGCAIPQIRVPAYR